MEKMDIVGKMLTFIDLSIPVSLISHDNLFEIQEFIFSGIPLTNIRETMTENDRNLKTIKMSHHSLITAGSPGVGNENAIGFHLNTQMDGALFFRDIRIIVQALDLHPC